MIISEVDYTRTMSNDPDKQGHWVKPDPEDLMNDFVKMSSIRQWSLAAEKKDGLPWYEKEGACLHKQ